jgi:hypothetical protein
MTNAIKSRIAVALCLCIVAALFMYSWLPVR